jgi:hypothetical protein
MRRSIVIQRALSSVCGLRGGAVLAALVLTSGSANAHDPLRCEIKVLAEKLRNTFAGQRVMEVSIGEVAPVQPEFPVESATAIRAYLVEELQRVHIQVKLRASTGLTVKYRGKAEPLKEDRERKRLVVEMTCVVTTVSGDNTSSLDVCYTITNQEAVLHILGPTTYLFKEPATGKAERETASAQQAVLSFKKPTAPLDGSIALASEKAPFGMEILVDDKPLTPRVEEGFAFVPLQRNQSYAIRLVNRSDLEVAVRLSVDGFNVFAFSEMRHKDGEFKGAPLYDMILIGPKDSVTVQGWHKNNEISARFKITEYAETAAARMNKATDLGTITATFCAAWEKTRPADEPDGTRSVEKDGTGFGADTTMKYTAVQRQIGAVRASVAVRYRVPAEKK